MENWVAVLGILGGVLSIAAAAGAVAVWFRASYNKARTEALQKDVEIYAQREQRHEKEMAEARGEINTLTAKVQALERQRDEARELATQRAAVDALVTIVRNLMISLNDHHDTLENHHEEAVSAWAEIRDLLKSVLDALRELKEKIDA